MKVYSSLIRICVLIIGLSGIPVFSASAQDPSAELEALSARSPIEKLYIHTDRETYLAGETVWLKAYLYSEFYPDTVSTNLHVELLSNHSSLITAKVFPVLFATSRGQVELPDTLPQGNYFIRAYSATMLNQGEEFVFLKSIYVAGKKNTGTETAPGHFKKIVSFFPESGNFIEGINNTIGFKITDVRGNPLNLSGAIKNQKNENIDSFITYHDGMGSFFLTPLANEKYYVELDEDVPGTRYELPVASKSGVLLRIQSARGGKNFELYHQPGDPAMAPAYILGQMQHRVSFRLAVDGTKKRVTGFINTENLSTGILHITVFNKDNMPLAERLCFVLNKDYLQAGELQADSLDFSEKGKNKLTLSLPPAVAGSFSVSVTDATYNGFEERNDNILSTLLLTSDLRGYIHQPSWYFSPAADKDSVNTALDLLMMTHGWRRFQWKTLTAINRKPLPYRDPGYIAVSGQINIRDRKKPLPNKNLMVLLFPQDTIKTTRMGFIDTDEKGRFRIDSMIFFDRARFFISDVAKKNEKWLDVYPDSDSLPVSLSLLPFTDYYKKPYGQPDGSFAEKMKRELDAYQYAEGKVLQGVTVKARTKTALEALEERYVSSLFGGMANHTIDLVNTKEAVHQLNIFDYIQGRIPGIQVQRDGIDYSLYYRQRMSLTGGPIPMLTYLDEVVTDPSVIASIPADQIAMIKVFSTFVGAEGNGAGGVLAIYTKKGEDFTRNTSTSADIFQYKGYSVVREFYSPDYSIDAKAQGNKPDRRITLYWEPDLFADGATTKIPIRFYNNERTKHFKVVIEGMTIDGQLLLIEKIFSSKAF